MYGYRMCESMHLIIDLIRLSIECFSISQKIWIAIQKLKWEQGEEVC